MLNAKLMIALGLTVTLFSGQSAWAGQRADIATAKSAAENNFETGLFTVASSCVIDGSTETYAAYGSADASTYAYLCCKPDKAPPGISSSNPAWFQVNNAAVLECTTVATYGVYDVPYNSNECNNGRDNMSYRVYPEASSSSEDSDSCTT